ncbi:carbohydrate binding domain-containing protein [uncultured Prevotella sp.]|uniref:carbohydrate binding domain-containing protein n=1 Tax=uncultured Prevotella sp. TaxID=159272 RepID=UPI002587D00E|nr:carbohydrate binding domain-containing protein [uncultured Prevotella sp.]
MRKTYMMLLALVLTMLGVSDAMAQKIYRAELDKSMFKAWTSDQPGATVVEEPAAIDVTDEKPNGTPFSCDNNLFKELGDWSGIFGNTSAYYLWYADLTGTKTMYFHGTPGLHFFVQFNRQAPEEGGDAHGGSMVQEELIIGDDGTVTYDCSTMEYVHLNCIKTKNAGIKGGVIKSMEIEGTVKPVSGILSLINNGDAEGTDLESFPVSKDGPNNGGTANDRPEIVEGGVDGGHCFKIVSDDGAVTETWSTQFYVKFDEPLQPGAKWKLSFAVKADNPAWITTSAQGAPRAWHDGFIDAFEANTEWKEYNFEGTVSDNQGKEGGFLSIAFDLNNGERTESGFEKSTSSNTFYFDNIQFGEDLGGANPMSDVKISAYADIICVNFAGSTNMADLVNAGGVTSDYGKTLIFDNSSAKVTINGVDAPILSVEGRSDGNLYIFPTDEAEIIDEGMEVKVAFKNPEDAAHQLVFKEGKWTGQPVPEFSGLIATIDDNLDNGVNVSYMYGAPALASVDPENGSFNLPADFKTFNVTFNQKVNAASVVAKLGNEPLTVTPAEGLVETVALTRTAATEIKGAVDLVISAVAGEKEQAKIKDPIVLNYSYGAVSSEAQPEVIYAANFSNDGDNAQGAGWKTNKDGGDELQDINTGAGCRLMHNQTAFASDILYVAQRESNPRCPNGVALYGIVEGYELALQPKEYHLTLDASKWDRDNERTLLVQVLPLAAVDAEHGTVLDENAILAKESKAITPTLASKEAIHFDVPFTVTEAGNYVIRMVPGDANGNPNGYADGCAVGNVKVEFIPDVMGVVETKTLNDALASATEAYNALANEENAGRYDGEDMTALKNLIDEVNANKANYTAPSVYNAKAEELNAAVKVANDHKSACDSYDENIKKAVDIVADNAEKKYSKTETYLKLKATIEKYHASKTTVNEAEEGEDPVWKTTYAFDVLKDNAELKAANEDLTNAVNVGTSLFTEVALDADIQQGNCGIAVLVERNRLGARTLMSLGVEESDPLIQAVKNSVVDDDDLAENIKARITTELYSKLKEENNDVFGPQVDEFGDPVLNDAGEIVNKSYDMTAFIKNPNIYAVDGTKDISEENIPGWTYPTNQKPGKFTAWGARNIEGLPEDCAFTTWFGTCRMEQTVTDLPAGIYVVSLCGSDWSNQAGNSDNPHDVNGFVYCKLSDTPEVIEGDEEDREINFAATRTIVYGGQYNMDHALKLGYAEVMDDETGYVSTSADGEFFGIPVTDGKLTLGIHFAGDAQYFFQHARLTLVAPAEEFDYATAYNTVVTNIDETVAPKVRAIQVYDLNGRRMIKANKGLQIVKKQMSDGSVRVEKVIVK